MKRKDLAKFENLNDDIFNKNTFQRLDTVRGGVITRDDYERTLTWFGVDTDWKLPGDLRPTRQR